MRVVEDGSGRTGRFNERHLQEVQQLESKCEEIISGFLRQRYGSMRIPFPTEALTILIEADLAMNLAR